MTDLQLVLVRLQSVIAEIDVAITKAKSPNDRYLSSSKTLIQREYENLSSAVTLSDRQSIMFYLRSIADMPKGIIDIGATWDGRLAIQRKEINDIATICHSTEMNLRTIDKT